MNVPPSGIGTLEGPAPSGPCRVNLNGRHRGRPSTLEDISGTPASPTRSSASRGHGICASALAIILTLAGCRSLPDELSKRETEVAATIQTQVTALADRPDRVITWPDALMLMHEQNLTLRQSRDAITTGRERLRQVNRDLIPGAALTANLTKGITQLGDLNGDDAALSLYGFFNVPGLIQWRMRHYTAELELIRTEWAHALKSRELTIQLRELFVRSTLLHQRRRQLALAQRWPQPGPLALSLDASPQKLEHESLLMSLRREAGALQDALGEILGDASVEWTPDPTGLPQFDYAADGLDLHDTARFGGLYRRLQAAEFEGARLRQRGIKLQYWPDLTLNLSSPPLYQSHGGRSWSADAIILNLGASVPIDLRGNISQQLRETKRDFARLEAKLREQNARTITGLMRARESLRLNTRQLRLAEARLDALRSLPAAQSPARTRDNFERLFALDQQRTSLLLEKTRLESLFWLLDESRWPAVAASPREPTPIRSGERPRADTHP